MVKIAPIKIFSMPFKKSMETHRIVRPKTRQKSYLRRARTIEKMGSGGGMGGMTTTGTGAGVVTIGMGSYPKRRKKRKLR